MKARSNTNIDDVAAIIGFSATVRLIHWFGGSNIYVPDKARPGHPLATLMGEPALRALCDEFGSQTLWIPQALERSDMALKKAVAKGLLKGRPPLRIAEELGITIRHLQRLRKELEDAGLLPLLPHPPDEDDEPEKPEEKPA